MINNQKGFSPVEFILLIVFVGLIAGVGWFVWRQNQSTPAESSKSTVNTQTVQDKPATQSPSPIAKSAEWKTASFELVEGSFKYPDSLKISHEVKLDAQPNTGIETYTLTASDETYIYLTAFHFLGGFTGDEDKILIDDAVTGTDKANNREFTAVTYKASENVYTTTYVLDSTTTKYKSGEKQQIYLNAFGVKPKGQNKDSTELSIILTGKKYKTFNTLAEIKAIGAAKDLEQFLNSLNFPLPN